MFFTCYDIVDASMAEEDAHSGLKSLTNLGYVGPRSSYFHIFFDSWLMRKTRCFSLDVLPFAEHSRIALPRSRTMVMTSREENS